MCADSPASLFGRNEKSARIRYRRLARSVHPDHGGSEEAMARLNSLWDEYNKADVPTEKTPIELTRCETYAVFDEDGMLVVERQTSSSAKSVSTEASKLAHLIDGSPVCMLVCKSSELIAQSDGVHAAYRCDAPDSVESTIMLPSLKRSIPNGVIHPRDLAWITKRVIYLFAAVEKSALTFNSYKNMTECLAISPELHMLVVMAPWELTPSDGSLLPRSGMVRDYVACMKGVAGSDKRNDRILRFMRGIEVDSFTPSIDILREYDELLLEMFGKPRFHVMEVKC